MTMFELITDLKRLGYWKALLCKDCMRTLDRYYDLYALIMKYEPEKRHGYVTRMMAREDFQALLPKDQYKGVRWEANNIYWANREMEREVFLDSKSLLPSCSFRCIVND